MKIHPHVREYQTTKMKRKNQLLKLSKVHKSKGMVPLEGPKRAKHLQIPIIHPNFLPNVVGNQSSLSMFVLIHILLLLLLPFYLFDIIHPAEMTLNHAKVQDGLLFDLKQLIVLIE
jgi:hypothetical protein